MAKRNDVEIPAGYRVLEDYEKVKVGDKVLYNPETSTTPAIDVDFNRHTYIGMPQNLLCGMAVRPIESSEWINKNDRMPTDADYNSGNGNIQVWEAKSDIPHLSKNPVEAGSYKFTYWRPVPPIPKPVEKPIIVREPTGSGRDHEVKFNSDGSLVVGCTQISSELFEQIAKRRQEKMK